MNDKPHVTECCFSLSINLPFDVCAIRRFVTVFAFSSSDTSSSRNPIYFVAAISLGLVLILFYHLLKVVTSLQVFIHNLFIFHLSRT